MSIANENSKKYIQKNRITIRPSEVGDKDTVIQLLNSPSIKCDIWDWQFEQAYYPTSARPIIAVDKWDNLLGFNGIMPVKLHTRQYGELDAAWSCDFFVSGEARGQGVGKKIKRDLKSQSQILFALGTSPTAARVLVQSGWKPYLKVYNYLLSGSADCSTSTSDLVLQTQLPAKNQLTNLWLSCKNDYGAIVSRDYDYLKWRYEDIPAATYAFIPQYDNGRLLSLAVIFQGENYFSLVDYIGPRKNTRDKEAIVEKLLSFGKTIKSRTSCAVWDDIFIRYEFKKFESPVNCFIYAEDQTVTEHICQDFYLMPGDCDGDILESSVECAKLRDHNSQAGLQVSLLSEAEFDTLELVWDALLSRSQKPNLFLCWKWVHTWWKTFSECHQFELCLLACWQDGHIVGLAPLYRRQYRRFGIKIKQLQLIGCSWSGPNAFRSEYLDFIIPAELGRQVCVALLRFIDADIAWDEFVLGDIPSDSLTSRLFEERYCPTGVYPRLAHSDYSVRVPANLSETEYKTRLSPNFRRNAFNKYQQLEQELHGKCKVYTRSDQCPFNIITTLNTMHIPRWGKPCFEGLSRKFHETIIKTFDEDNRLLVVAIEEGDKPVSLAYNLVFGDSIYNIQLGFIEEHRLSRFSLGLLQLGQCIIFAINSKTFSYFDLLAGFGKQEYYKSRFGGFQYHIQTKQYLRSKRLVYLYKIYDHKHQGMLRIARSIIGRLLFVLRNKFSRGL